MYWYNVDDANTINIKLFPNYHNPPFVYDYQVPVCMINLESIIDRHWDMTLQRV